MRHKAGPRAAAHGMRRPPMPSCRPLQRRGSELLTQWQMQSPEIDSSFLAPSRCARLPALLERRQVRAEFRERVAHCFRGQPALALLPVSTFETRPPDIGGSATGSHSRQSQSINAKPIDHTISPPPALNHPAKLGPPKLIACHRGSPCLGAHTVNLEDWLDGAIDFDQYDQGSATKYAA